MTTNPLLSPCSINQKCSTVWLYLFPLWWFFSFLFMVLWDLNITCLGVVVYMFIQEFSEPQWMEEEKPGKCYLTQNVSLFPWSHPTLFCMNLVNFSTFKHLLFLFCLEFTIAILKRFWTINTIQPLS